MKKKHHPPTREQKRHKLADDLRHPLVDGLHPYAPLATGYTVDFFFGQRKAAEAEKLEGFPPWRTAIPVDVSK